MKSVYVVLCRTETILSRLISKTTGDWYTHASISLDDDLQTMCSFGRRWAYCPYPGGFVRESVRYGTLRRFRYADTTVMRIEVSDEKYAEIKQYLDQMYTDRKKYKYNYWGALLAKWRKRTRVGKANRFYCSEFVIDFLERFGIIEQGELGQVARPMELLKLHENGRGKVIYRGALCRFAATKI